MSSELFKFSRGKLTMPLRLLNHFSNGSEGTFMTQCSILLKYFLFVRKREQNLVRLGIKIFEGMLWELQAMQMGELREFMAHHRITE